MTIAWVVVGTVLGVILAILIKEWVDIYVVWEKHRTLKGTMIVKGQVLEYKTDKCTYLLSIPAYITTSATDINKVSKDDLIFTFKNLFTDDDNRLYRELIKSIKVVKRDDDEFDKYSHKINDEKKECIECNAKAEKKFLLHKQLFLSIMIALALTILYFVLNEQSPVNNITVPIFILCGVAAFFLRLSFFHKVASDEILNHDLLRINKKLQLVEDNPLIEIMWTDGHKGVFVLMLNNHA